MLLLLRILLLPHLREEQDSDEADVRKRARDYVAAFAVSDIETSVHYAGKAFITTKVAQWVNQEGLGIDVASAGELEVALRAGIDPAQIVMH